MPRRLAALLLAALAGPAGGVIVGPGEGSETAAPPADDPGFAHLGQRGEVTAISLGGGWMLTAAHAAPGDVVVAGTSYPFVAGSHALLAAPEPGAPPPDLALFRVDPSPRLPALALRSRPPAVGDEVVLAGFGRDRGEAIRWRGIRGFAWAATHAMRWGTNQVHASGLDFESAGFRTRAFSTQFNAFGTRYEAQATHGDSGGAAFLRGPDGWELAGVLLSVALYEGQPSSAALYGNQTLVADLSAYRAEILARTRPDTAAPGGPDASGASTGAPRAPQPAAGAAPSRGDHGPAGTAAKPPPR